MMAVTRRFFMKSMAMAAFGLGMGVTPSKGETQPIHSGIRRIFLITIDTLRADHCGFHGYPRPTTPFLDNLARSGVVFKRAFASSATTAPSHASIISGLYPIQSQVLQNGLILEPPIVTLPELLSEKGFDCAGFVSSSPQFVGFDQGFANFDRPSTQISTTQSVNRRDAGQTIDSFVAWLNDREPESNIFVWIHLFDPHSPLQPPGEALAKFRVKDSGEKKDLVELFSNGHQIDLGFWNNDTDVMLNTMNRYDGEINFVDTELKRLHSHVVQKGFGKDSLWIITSDHGEGLGNHRHYGHGKHIYNAQLHVPLIFHFPSSGQEPMIIDDVVENTDIFQTVADLTGIDSRRQILPVQGASLLPLFRKGCGRFPKESAFSQRRTYRNIPFAGTRKPRKNNYEAGQTFALQDKQCKLIYRSAGRDEFFELNEDPYEVSSLKGRDHPREKLLREELMETIERLSANNRLAPSDVRDKETLDQLRQLGYI